MAQNPSDMPKFALRDGDVVLCEGNSADLVGRGAIWRSEIPNCVHQNRVLRVRVLDASKVLPDFILEYINCSAGQAYFRRRRSERRIFSSINSKEVAAMPLPLPDTLKEQRRILAVIGNARRRAGSIRERAATARSEALSDFLSAIFQ